ncbi:glycerophosphodiester phosphodiesterase family protein [uncultured Shewanella sp.]|uniref:glycerophosphodiester phosphodiesterase family protein n=1 Tax=uncultured Shewanella sp. TaxID=173975 RepID=UPI002623BD42|nr:glycerophosphodiester phosphodiesterase family protein [uncultured Shewanella sp.]
MLFSKKNRHYACVIACLTFITACNDDNSDPLPTELVENADENTQSTNKISAQLGPRPLFLVRDMQDSELKTTLEQCATQPFYRSDFSIGHRGAAMQFPEHTKESYQAAIDSGAGIVECDVTFTSDKQLVCRHSQCDLATTTNILAIPELANQCNQPFTPADLDNGITASATCCTSDITVAEFKSLCGKMDAFNPEAMTAEEYMDGTANWRTDLYSSCGTVMTHAESIALFKEAGVKMTPELKTPSITMPYDGYSQADFAKHMLDEYIAADVAPSDVYPQSFQLEDLQYWLTSHPEYAKQGVYLDGRYDLNDFDPNNAASWSPTMDELKNQGINIIAPPLWALVTLDDNNNIVPSNYAKAATAANLKIITWTLERSGLLKEKGGWYYQSISEKIQQDGDTYELLDVLAQDVGVIGVFSDWPATVTYYANCHHL